MADNARFHNKLHRANHYSIPVPGYPDSGTDPIASPEAPFQGDFIVNASVSANNNLYVTNNALVGGNTTILGNLSVYGDYSYFETYTSTTSALSVINHGQGPAIVAVQYGDQPVVRFIDANNASAPDGVDAFSIESGGNIVINGNDAVPGRRVTIAGSMTASGNTEFQAGSAAGARSTASNRGISIGDDSASFNSSLAYGSRSFAAGESNIASGSGSFVIGFGNLASGNYSVAAGLTNIASGSASLALGQNNIASNTNAFAHGKTTIAAGIHSHAEGRFTAASGSNAHSEGEYTNATGLASHAEGQYTSSLGSFSHSEGQYTVSIGAESHTEGQYTSAYGIASHAEGLNSRSFATGSHAEGYFTAASALYSHTEGQYTSAFGVGAHAEGLLSIASGGWSHAEGYNTIAAGIGSHTDGANTVAYGSYSRAGGLTTVAVGSASMSIGYATTAYGNYSLATGISTYTANSGTIAAGSGSQAYGINSIAFGNNTLATGDDSFTANTTNIAAGSGSFAAGRSTRALGETSFTTGLGTVATNCFTHAEGKYTSAFGPETHAEGNLTYAYGADSHAEGYGSSTYGPASHAEGINTSTGPLASGAYASGYASVAQGAASIAAGYRAYAAKDFSYVWSGDSTALSGISSTSTGQYLVSAPGGIYFPGNVGIGTSNNTNALTIVGDTSAAGNMTITGNLSVYGALSYLDTIVSITSALSVINLGTGPALVVSQKGAQPIARFEDADGFNALFIEDSGFVGINIGTPAERLTVAGNVSASGGLSANGGYHANAVGIGTNAPGVSLYSGATNTVKLDINNNTVLPLSATTGTIVHLTQADSTNSRILVDSFGAVANARPSFTGRHAEGTGANPTAVVTGDVLCEFTGQGFGATKYSSTSRGRMTINAAETWTDTANGTYLTFQTTPNTTLNTAEAVRIDQTGNVGIGITTPAERLTVAGNVSSSGGLSANGGYYANNVGIKINNPAVELTVAGSISASNTLSANNAFFYNSVSANYIKAYSTESNQVTANTIYGFGSETVFTDGSSLTGNGINTLTLNYLNGVYNSSFEVFTTSGGYIQVPTVSATTLSARYITLVHGQPNDGVNPIFRIGEQDTTLDGSIIRGFSGFDLFYNEISNLLTLQSNFSASYTPITAVLVDRFGNTGLGIAPTGSRLTVAGSVSASGGLSGNNGYYAGSVGLGTTAPTAKLDINNNAAAPRSVASGTTVHVTQTDSTNNRILVDSFGAVANARPSFTGRHAEGTAASPTAVIAGDVLCEFTGQGWGATGYSTSSRGRMTINAAENWSDIANGTYLTFQTTPNATISTVESMRIDQNGNVGISIVAPAERLTVAGNVSASGGLSANNGYYAGNIGIKINNPVAELTVAGSISASSGLSANNAAFTGNVSVTGNIVSLGYNVGTVPVNIQTGTTYTIRLSDIGSTIGSTNAGTGLTATIVGTYPVGFSTSIVQLSTARVAISGQNVTINQANGYFRTTKQYSAASLVYTGAIGGWVLFGDVSA